MTRYVIRDEIGTFGDFASATEACIFAIQTGIATKWEWVIRGQLDETQAVVVAAELKGRLK